MTKHRMTRSVGLFLTYSVLIFTIIVILFPLAWIISGSVNPASFYSATFFPENVTLVNFRALFEEGSLYPTWYFNTIKIATINCALAVVFTTMTAYAFSRYRFPGRKAGLMTILILQMFPGILALVAIFVFLLLIGLLDSHWGLILVYAGGQIPFNTWLMKGYLDGIPSSLDDAAQIDGAGHLTRFVRIILPLATPIVSVVALFNFFGPIFDYIFPRIVLRSPENFTLALGLWNLIAGRQSFGDQNYAQFAAGAILIAVPCAVVYLIFQNYLISGLAQGATK